MRHVLLRDREPLLRGRLREPRAHAAVGSPVRLRRRRPGSTSAARPTGSSRRRSGAGRRSRATGIAPGTPVTRSSSRSARRTCSSRRSRWRRSTRCSRTAGTSSPRTSSRTSSSPAGRARRASCCGASRRRLRSSAGVDPAALARGSRRPLPGDALGERHVVRRLRQLLGADLRARREPRRRSSRFPAIRATTSRTSPGGAAGARPTTARLVVCALIENGGHGSSGRRSGGAQGLRAVLRRDASTAERRWWTTD